VHDPAQEVVPWGPALSKNESLSNWNELVKPGARDFKPFREANNRVDHKDGFVMALKAQHLTHLVETSCTVIDPDLDTTHQNHLRKVMRDAFLCHEAKSIVKFHSNLKTKDTRVIWEKMCKIYDKSIVTLMNGGAVITWSASVKLDAQSRA